MGVTWLFYLILAGVIIYIHVRRSRDRPTAGNQFYISSGDGSISSDSQETPSWADAADTAPCDGSTSGCGADSD